MKKSAYLIIAACLALAVSLAGPSAATAAKEALVIDLVSEPTTLDPHKQWNPSSFYVYRNIFDNMLTRTPSGEIIPQVAVSWKYQSPTVIDFKIRTDIKFHDGTPLTVDDVVFSVLRIIDPAFKSPQAGQFNTVTNAEAVDGQTVRLTTKVPYPVLLAQLVKLSIVPKTYVTSVGDEAFNRNPVGSGPYQFVEWKKGIKVVLQANRDYWRGNPPFAVVEFHAVPEKSTRVANLRTGKSDLAVSLDADIAVQLKSDPKVKVLSVPTERVAYFRINTLAGPTADVRVRKAIAHAIDRDLIVNGLQGGYSKKVNVMVGDTSFGYDDSFQSYDYDPEKAKSLLKEAGLGDTEVEILTAPAVFDQRVVEAIQQMLRNVGINAKISGMDMATFLKRMQSSPEDKDPTSFGRWSCACQDADGILYAMLDSQSIWSNINNPELDAALEKGRSTLKPEERMQYYRQAHQIIQDQVPLVPLYQVGIIYGGARQLQWQPTPDEGLFVMDMSWQE